MKFNDFIVSEEKVRLDPKCWTGKKIGNPKTKVKGGVRVNNCVPAESINEDGKRCMQCGMTNCSCPGDSCKCKPIKGWVPGKGFKKAIDEAANAAQQAAIAIAKKKKAGVDEAAPPGAKAERMVKHIKKGYAKDGKLSDKEKSIAYATAWKAHNKGVTEAMRPVPVDDQCSEYQTECLVMHLIGLLDNLVILSHHHKVLLPILQLVLYTGVITVTLLLDHKQYPKMLTLTTYGFKETLMVILPQQAPSKAVGATNKQHKLN